jgi:hypothetical protein
MSFNFGKEQVTTGGSGVAIFSNGEAGRVKSVSVSVLKKGVDYQDEGKNKPDYQITYTDANGATTNDGVYYLDAKKHVATFTTFEKAVEKQWNKLASIIVAADGDPSINATSPVEMLDKMALLVKSSVTGKTFNVFANYGTKQSPKKYIQIRSWVPFIEPSSTTDEETKLKASGLDQIERLVQDTPGTPAGAPAMDGWV